MMAGRILLLLVVIGGLLLPGYRSEHDSTRLIVLIDQSDGMVPESVATARDRLAADLEPLDAALDVRAYAYGTGGSAASTKEALREALWRLQPASQSGIVVISDGFWRVDMATLLQGAAEAGVSVFWLPARSDDPKPRVVAIDAPDRVRPGQRVQISVATDVPVAGDYTVVLYANGDPVGRRPLVPNEPTTLPLSVAATGALRLDAELINSETGESLDRLRDGALLNVISPPRLLVVASDYSAIAESLAAGGWSVTRVSPRAFAGLTAPISSYSALILDDVATTDMPAAAWVAITQAVRRDALGLLVLGGPNSFGLGAYRGSVLEEVLPVISEPPQDETPASVVFLVDISGSMAGQPGGADSLRVARDAVLYTAAALRPVDRVGLIAFDVEARQLLSPATRDDHAMALRRAWPEQASGGTSVIPALDLAQSALAREPAEQKLLVLVTDGMLSAGDLAELEARLQANELDFIAMILSDGRTQAPLSRIALGDSGSLLMIDDVLQLPVLMRKEVESLRPALMSGRTTPIVLSAPPFAGLPEDWPALDAYLVTRARPEATVMLAAGRSEPLFAAWTAGAGRVVVLTGGLNQWASEWLMWPQWPELVSGLMNFIAVTDSDMLRFDIGYEQSNRLSILVDTGSARNMSDPLLAQLVRSTGPPMDISLAPVAPGRYRASVSADQAGQYTLVWEDDAGNHRHSFILKPGPATRSCRRTGRAPLHRRRLA